MLGSIFLITSGVISIFNLSMIGYRELDLIRKVRSKLNKNGFEIKGKNKNLISDMMVYLDRDINHQTLIFIELVLSIPPIINLYLLRINIKRLFGIHNEYIDDEYDETLKDCTSYALINYLTKEGLIQKRKIDLSYVEEDIDVINALNKTKVKGSNMNKLDLDIKKEFEGRDDIKLSELLKKYDSYELNEALTRLCADRFINATYEEDPTFMIMKKENKKLVMKKGNEDEKRIN